MKRTGLFAATLLGSVAIVMWLGAGLADAQGRGQGRPTSVGKPAGAGKPTTAGRPTTPGPQGRGTAPGQQKKTTSTVRGGAGATTSAGSTTTATDTSSGATVERGGPKTPQEHLKQNTQLAARVQKLLPVGSDVLVLSQGFRNLGQFVAAVHASRNLGIRFDQLKMKMVTAGMSLGQAIKTLRRNADAGAAVRTAEQQARTTMSGSSTSGTSASTATRRRARNRRSAERRGDSVSPDPRFSSGHRHPRRSPSVPICNSL